MRIPITLLAWIGLGCFAAFAEPPVGLPATAVQASGSGEDLTLADLMRRRDPFQTPAENRNQTEQQIVDSGERLTPGYGSANAGSFRDLEMIGVITGPDRMRAMLQGPDGNTLFVSENEKIGADEGIVRKVTESSVQIIKRVRDPSTGKSETIVTDLKLVPEARKRTE